MSSSTQFTFTPIGYLRSPVKDKFAVPRQAGLVPELTAHVEILPEFSREEAFREIDGFSHIWLLSVFHQAIREQWQPMVRPPRLGGNARVGVFASRSPFRPNPLGLSLVEFKKLEWRDKQLTLLIGGCDLVDGTPVLDIKPYLPYADLEPNASNGYTKEFSMATLPVEFSREANDLLDSLEHDMYPDLRRLITRLIQQDPRPAYQEHLEDRLYAFRLHVFDVVFRVQNGKAIVEELRELK